MAAKIFRINYKSDFILTLESDAGWMTPFCIKFWTGAPSQAYFVSFDGETYTHCAPVAGEPTKLQVQFDDHHLPIGDLKFQVAYHFTVADFPNDTEDEVINPANITTEIDGQEYQVMLDFTGETAPEIQFSLPAYANESQRIANEEERIENEQQRIANEAQRIQNEETRINQEQTRQDNEAQRIRNEQTRISQEEARVREFATLKHDAQEATTAANDAAALANQKAQLAADKAQLAADKAALAQDAAALANEKAQLAAAKATLANDAAALANQKAEYAKDQGDYAKEQGDYAKRKGDDAAAQTQQQAQAFSEAQAARQTAYEQAEGTESGSEAGDGSRWGAFKTNEAARDAKVDAKVADITNLQEAVAEGAVYDISANHLTEGVPTKYANLSAALGADGANVPVDKRKGGMSIKFIQSSDNKYVQYRYKGTDTTGSPNPFLDTDNWEKYGNNDTILTPTDLGNSYAIDKTGEVYTNQYIDGSSVLVYSITNKSFIKIHTKTPPFHNGKNIMIGGLYKSGVLVYSFGVMLSNTEINKIYDFMIFNNYYDADTLKLSISTSYKEHVLVTSSSSLISLKNEKVAEQYIQPTNIQYGACVTNNGDIKTQYVDDTNVLTFSIEDTKSVNIEFKSYTYSSPCVIGALYKNGNFIKHLGAMSVEQYKRINILNDGLYDTLKLSVLNTEMWNTMVTTSPIDDEFYAKIDTVSSIISALTSDVSQVTLLPVELVNDEKINATTLSIGDTYSSVANSWRGLYKIDVAGKNGFIKINNAIYSGGCEVVVCNSNNIVLDVFPANNANSRASIVGVNLKKYTDATTIYIDGKPNGATSYSDVTAEYTNYSVIKDSTKKTDCATILLHFDGVDNDLTKFISERKGFCAEYGINKGSFCVSPFSFNASLTDWASPTIKNEYFAAIADGWDCALYPNRASADYDEEDWDDWFDNILPKIEALGVCNITTLAAGQLFVNDGLLASAKKHGFKIIRGGAASLPGSIIYTFGNAYTPQGLSDRDCYIFDTITNISTKQTTDNLGELKNHIDYCVQSKSAISVIAHSIVPDNETSSTDDINCGITNFQAVLAYIKNYIDAGVLRVMSWREWYAMMNPADGGTNDYCRLLKLQSLT